MAGLEDIEALNLTFTSEAVGDEVQPVSHVLDPRDPVQKAVDESRTSLETIQKYLPGLGTEEEGVSLDSQGKLRQKLLEQVQETFAVDPPPLGRHESPLPGSFDRGIEVYKDEDLKISIRPSARSEQQDWEEQERSRWKSETEQRLINEEHKNNPLLSIGFKVQF